MAIILQGSENMCVKKVRYDLTDIFAVGMELTKYNLAIKEAELLNTEALDRFEKNTALFDKLNAKCQAIGVKITDVKWNASFKSYIKIRLNLKKEKHNALCKNFITEKNKALSDFNASIRNNTDNEIMIFYEQWRIKYSLVINAANILANDVTDEDYDNVKIVSEQAIEFLKEINEKSSEIRNRIVERQKQRMLAIQRIQPVEGHNLDKQQIDCIIADSHNRLVIAGAGTGKTTTIVGLVKYLIKSDICTSDEILLLSYTKKAAEEMKHRIKSEINADMDVFTFHKLGCEIISGVENKRPSVYSKSIQEYAHQSIREHLSDEKYMQLMIEYCMYSPSKSASEFDFSSKAEYDEYISLNQPVTIKRESVKSYCELEIANYLYSNNIRYTYEKLYEYDLSNTEYSGYYPDFYLDDYGIYIEFFAVNIHGEVPSYFSGGHGKNANDLYIDGIKWKRETHHKYGTKLVEVSYADKQCGKLLENLKAKLEAMGVVFEPKSEEQLWNNICEENNEILSAVSNVIGTIITHIKSNGYTFEQVINSNVFLKYSHILRLTEPVYNDYTNMLQTSSQIDFSDMIHNAADYISQGKANHTYKYVIVDEYQDISKARYRLLDELRKSKDFNLFCVGDDWQSIYRFAGSDIGYILNFEKYWGTTLLSRIETTYRFGIGLINISGNFVMQNPVQIQKSLQAEKREESIPLGFINAYNDKYLIQFMTDKLKELEKNSSVFFIGRYTYDKKMFNDSKLVQEKDNVIVFPERPDLKMEFITAHKSKGLQADYVFILNTKNKGLGFPSKIQDEPVIQMLVENSDVYPYAEERRLFYVAMTRARKKVWLLVQQGNEGIFAKELMNKYGDAIQREEKREFFTCPECGGRLVKRSGPYGEFLGCTNYSKTGCRYKRNIKHK